MSLRTAPVLGWLLVIAAASPVVAGPSAPDVSTVVRGLQAWLDGTQTLEARFRQSLVSGALGATTTEAGRLYLERPGKLRFDYLDPERKTAILVGGRTELYLEQERQLSRGRLTGEEGMFPRLLVGRDRVDDLFVATVLPVTVGGRGASRLKLVPKADGGALAEVTLTLRLPEFSIEGAEVLDEMGNRTTYAFSGSKRNGRLPPGVFAFEPPPGTEIVEER